MTRKYFFSKVVTDFAISEHETVKLVLYKEYEYK